MSSPSMNSDIIFSDGRGRVDVELFESEEDGSSSIMISAASPAAQHFSLTAAEARLLAARLMDYADQQELRGGS